MSTPAQVTEAHLRLANQLVSSPPSPLVLATLIADSEAKAVVELKKRADHWCDMHTVCAKERDQLRAELEKVYALVTPDGCDLAPRGLFETARAVTELRAEVERLKRDYDYDHKCLYEVRERCELWKQRAERAELRVKQLEESK